MKSLVLEGEEASTLAECEAVIEKGMDTFLEVGNALLRIRDERLYRVGFSTFQEYCQARWQMGAPPSGSSHCFNEYRFSFETHGSQTFLGTRCSFADHTPTGKAARGMGRGRSRVA